MKGHNTMRSSLVLPLPRFVLHPLTALVIAGVHVYLASGHLTHLFGGEVEWTHIWKGFGALGELAKNSGQKCLSTTPQNFLETIYFIR